jgi:O-antigen ligase
MIISKKGISGYFKMDIQKNLTLSVLVILVATLTSIMALVFSWYAILICAVPFFIWASLRHFKHITTTFIFIYFIIHLSASTYIFTGTSIASALRIIVFFGLVAVVVINHMFNPKKLYGFRLSSVSYILLFLLSIVLTLGSMNSLSPAASIQYLIWYTVFGFLILFLIPREYGSTKSIINLFYAFLLAGFIYEVVSIFTLTSVGITDRGGNIAIRGLFSNNNMMGMIALSTSLLSFIALVYKDHLTRGKALIVKTSALVSPLFVILSSSRASIIGLLTSIMLLGMVEKRTRKLSIFTFVIVILFVVFGESLLYAWFRIDSLMASGGIFGDRTKLFQYAIQSIPYIPWYGLGIGMQGNLYLINLNVPAGLIGPDGNTLGFHNAYLQIMVETGIAGLLIYGVILISTFRKAFTTKEKSSKKLILSMCAILGGLMVNSFFESALLLPGSPYSLIFWIIVCLVHIVHYRSKKYPNEQ